MIRVSGVSELEAALDGDGLGCLCGGEDFGECTCGLGCGPVFVERDRAMRTDGGRRTAGRALASNLDGFTEIEGFWPRRR